MVVTVVGCSGGASGGGFAEHGGGCPLVADELGDAVPDTCLAVWVQADGPGYQDHSHRSKENRPQFPRRHRGHRPGARPLHSLSLDPRAP